MTKAVKTHKGQNVSFAQGVRNLILAFCRIWTKVHSAVGPPRGTDAPLLHISIFGLFGAEVAALSFVE